MLIGLRQLPARLQRALMLLALTLAAGLLLASAALAEQPSPPEGPGPLDAPSLVVALDKLDGTRYARSVMVAVPWKGGHVGFILNKPSRLKMGMLFPDHAPSRAVTEPVYLGGPTMVQTLFAMMRSQVQPGERALAMGPGVWLLIHQADIDGFMEGDPNAARYYMGYVQWRPGELAAEVRSGQVMLRPFDAQKLFAPDTGALYEGLVPPDRKPPLGT